MISSLFQALNVVETGRTKFLAIFTGIVCVQDCSWIQKSAFFHCRRQNPELDFIATFGKTGFLLPRIFAEGQTLFFLLFCFLLLEPLILGSPCLWL